MAYFIVNRNSGREKEWWGFGTWWDSLYDMLALAETVHEYQNKLFYIYVPYYMNDGSPSIWCDTDANFEADSRLPEPYTFPKTLELIRLYAPLLKV